MIEKLIAKLNMLGPMNAELTEKISSMAKVQHYKAGDFILKEGQTCTRACLIAKGLTRSYYINEGKDITSRFMDEGYIVTSWISYYSQKPGNEFIEAIEDTSLVCVDYTEIQKLYKESTEFNIIGRRQVEYAFYLAEERTQLLRKHTAIEKYQYIMDNYPSLLQRVPLKHMATYLGMSEETFSRVRSKFHRNS
jgi:CRP/FNR family transcriptional regulator, anaerobic regulatory protein